MEMKCLNLASKEIIGSHTGENLAGVIDETLKEWHLKCFSCTHDTAANMNSALQNAMEVRFDFGCMAHILQLSINDSLDENNGLLADLI